MNGIIRQISTACGIFHDNRFLTACIGIIGLQHVGYPHFCAETVCVLSLTEFDGGIIGRVVRPFAPAVKINIVKARLIFRFHSTGIHRRNVGIPHDIGLSCN